MHEDTDIWSRTIEVALEALGISKVHPEDSKDPIEGICWVSRHTLRLYKAISQASS